MWVVVIGCLICAVKVLNQGGFVSPLNSTTLLRISGGKLIIRRGRLQADARNHVSDMLRDAGVCRGFVAITSRNRIVFSRSIPSSLHQRLRNVLINQWA